MIFNMAVPFCEFIRFWKEISSDKRLQQTACAVVFLEFCDKGSNVTAIVATECLREGCTMSEKYFEETHPRYSLDEIRQHFHITRPSFEIILAYLGTTQQPTIHKMDDRVY